MKTHWNVSVCIDGTARMSTGDVTLAGVLARAITDAVYYQAVYPSGKVTFQRR